MKRKEIYTQDAGAIDTAIARPSRDINFREARLTKHALAKSLEGIGFNAANNI